MIQFSLLPNQTLGIFVIANYKKKNHQPNNQFFFSFINIDFFLDQVRPRMSYWSSHWQCERVIDRRPKKVVVCYYIWFKK